MFDVLGFSNWMADAGLTTVLDSYHRLIEQVVVAPNFRGGLAGVQTPEGSIFALTGPPGYAYFSDTIILWHPLKPAFVDDFVSRCNELICEALAMDIPLRGALSLGEAVLDNKSDFYLGEVVVEAAKLERAQNWIGLDFSHSALWGPFLAQLHGTAIIEYQPPMKEGLQPLGSPIVADWPRRFRDKYGECPSSRLRRLDKQPEFSSYWQNTIRFAEYSLAKHDWHLRPNEIPEDALLRLVPPENADFGPLFGPDDEIVFMLPRTATDTP